MHGVIILPSVGCCNHGTVLQVVYVTNVVTLYCRLCI